MLKSCNYLLVFKRVLLREWKTSERWSETLEFENPETKTFTWLKLRKLEGKNKSLLKAIWSNISHYCWAWVKNKKEVSSSPTLVWAIGYLSQGLSSTPAITDLFPEEHLWRSFHVSLWQCIWVFHNVFIKMRSQGSTITSIVSMGKMMRDWFIISSNFSYLKIRHLVYTACLKPHCSWFSPTVC